MSTDASLPIFVAECEELLHEMERGLLICTRGSADPETINLIFRAAHTIKGSSGLFALDGVVHFVHGVETVLDRARLGEVPIDASLADLLLTCKDHIGALVAAAIETTGDTPAPLERRSGELLEMLQKIAGGSTLLSQPVQGKSSTAVLDSPAGVTGTANWHISVRFGPEVLTLGLDPLSFVRYLATFGEIRAATVIDEALPPAAGFDPEKCYVGFEIDFCTAADQARIESAFEFVRQDCKLAVAKIEAPTEARILEEAAPPEPRTEAIKTAVNRTVRVDADKLDFLIDRIGELITAAARSNLVARRAQNAELEETTQTVESLIEQVRESALQLRMVRIGATFDRFERVVHDVSREIGKEIKLLVSGEETELDKTVVERIADPLTHLVRNAIDHGIEPTDVRLARGKPSVGVIRLNAYHDSGHVVIEVVDDGGGLDRDRILKKGLERGLIETGRSPSDSELFALVFEPGFSTADKVTNLSGRGVGMDVVKRNITALMGTVSISSEPGVGTTVTVRLPLTLAIINGFQISIGETIFVLPLDSIDECLEFSEIAGHDFTDLRGELLPFLRLREVFHIKTPPSRRQSIVVVRNGARRAGLVVDSLLGEFQTVIKPLSGLLGYIDCITGSSILGTGEVALIVDVPALLALAVRQAAA